MTILVTKLFVPPPSPKAVLRPQLAARLDAGLSGKVSLVCAPAGFGKSTLLSAWVDACQYPSAWLSLDAGDGDTSQFLSYLIAALQTISHTVGAGIPGMLRASPAPSAEAVLTVLLNDLSATRSKLVLVLDDYHAVASAPVDRALAFLIEHLPPQLHLVIATREDPNLPLARLRVRGQLTELRQDDLRFGLDEARAFLNQTMSLQLSAPSIAALDARTEGWIAGLQLAAISLRGRHDQEGFIAAFSGCHQFVQEYLLDEVLRQQSDSVQAFLLRTSMLDRLCARLCDAVLESEGGQDALDYLVQANLFIVPLDSEKRWYRYHHLFADLLRQRLRQQHDAAPYHVRASQWYEANGLDTDAFHQAVAAADIARATRLIEGNGMPLYFRGEMVPVIHWMQTQRRELLDAQPGLWLMFAWSLLMAGQFGQLEPVLASAEAALRDCADADSEGQLATLRAWLAVPSCNVESIHAQASRAIGLLDPRNVPACTAARCALGVSLLYRSEFDAASAAFSQVISAGKSSGNTMFIVVASIALAGIHATNNALHLAAATYRDAIRHIADPSNSVGCQAHLGLARILYEWNELEEADAHARHSIELATRQEHDSGAGEALRARVLLARDDSAGALALLEQASVAAKSKRAGKPLSEVVAVQALAMLERADAAAAAGLAAGQELPLLQARILLAQGSTAMALAVAQRYSDSMQAKRQPNEVLKAMLVQVVILDAQHQGQSALAVLVDAVARAEPAGCVRLFVDEGPAIEVLLSQAAVPARLSVYVAKLLGAFALNTSMKRRALAAPAAASPLAESYSRRELEILRLIHAGRSNQEISEHLFLSLSTVKWHNQNIFAKLQVQRRTEAVARALSLKLITG